MESVFKDMESRMKKSIESFQHELTNIRTGRANTAVLDSIRVEYYGSSMPVNQVASISIIEAKTLDVKPWDRAMVQIIEKAVMAANLGLSVINSGDSLKIKFPELTEETRKDLVKKVKKLAEEKKVDIRNIRRDGNDRIKEMEKNKKISEDDRKHAEEKIQKLTDRFIKETDDIAKDKETDLMTV